MKQRRLTRILPLTAALASAVFVLGALSNLPLFDTRPFHSISFASDLNLTEVDCRCCHSEGVPDRHHVLVETTSLECTDCHELVWNEMIQQYSVILTRDCLVCHTGSLADRHHTLPNYASYNCFSCHTLRYDPETGDYILDFLDECEPRDSTFGSIKGLVTGSEAGQLRRVTITAAEGQYSTLTVSDGSFQLDEVDPGDYTLVASKAGYSTESYPIAVATGQTARVDFVLAPTYETSALSWGTASVAGVEYQLGSKIGNSLFCFLIPVGTLLLWKSRGRRK